MHRISRTFAVLFISHFVVVPAAVAADDQVQRNPPASQQNPSAEHAPTNRIDKALPTMKSESTSGQPSLAPTNRMGKLMPQMESDASKKADEKATKDANTGTGLQKPAQN